MDDASDSGNPTWRSLALTLRRATSGSNDDRFGVLDELRCEVEKDHQGWLTSRDVSFIRRAGDRHFGLMATLLRRSVDLVALECKTSPHIQRANDNVPEDIAIDVLPEDLLRAVWEVIPQLLRQAVTTLEVELQNDLWGTKLLNLINHNKAFLRHPSNPPWLAPSTFKADLADALSSGLSTERKMLGAYPRALSRHGVEVELEELTDLVSRTRLPFGLSMLDSVRAVAVDTVLCGCTSECYVVVDGHVSETAPHRKLYETFYGSDQAEFARVHTKQKWFDQTKLAIFGGEPALWSNVDFTSVCDPKAVNTINQHVPVAQLPVQSNRYCPAVFGDAFDTLREVVLNSLCDLKRLDYARRYTLRFEPVVSDSLPLSRAPKLPLVPERSMPLLSARRNT
jgi:hypothetical protein